MNKIDIHHHFIPKIAREYIKNLPEWSPKLSSEFLKKNGFDSALLSLPNLNIEFESKTKYLEFCRSVNKELSNICKNSELKGLGIIPFPYIEESVIEINYIMNNGLDGIILYTNYNEVYPSTIEHYEIFENLNNNNATVFIHPNDTPYIKDKDNSAINWTVEFPLEVTRLYSRFLVEDKLKTLNKIQFILGYGGGTLSFLIDRIAKIPYVKGMKPRIGRLLVDMISKKNRALDHLKLVNFDLYTVNRDEQLAALKTHFNNKNLIKGSNFPFCKDRMK